MESSQHDTVYRFISTASPQDDPLQVIRFCGNETISKPFKFDLELKSKSEQIDPDALLDSRCCFEMTVGGKTRKLHGMLISFDTIGRTGEFTVYRAVLVPRLWQLSFYQTNEVYIDKSLPDILKLVLLEAGLTALDFELRLWRDYPNWSYRCQFGETHLAFLSRLLEHEGIYYFFEHDNDVDKVIFCDSQNVQTSIPENQLRYAAPTGLDALTLSDTVHHLMCRRKRLPERIVLKDYNDENPSVNIKGEAQIDEKGIGEVYDYGSNIDTPEQGKILAQIRAEELACEKNVYHGEGLVARMSAGYQFSLGEHYQSSFNQSYLLMAVEHEGHEPSMLTGEGTDRAAYSNTFTAIPASIQYRPPRATEKPRFNGTMNAFIDAEGDGQYAEVDPIGRYKVVLPFDRVKRQESKASCWIRMAQPYAGESEGMHFPLRKGAEVLLTFIGGDPDRPVIASAVPNHGRPSVVTSQNQTANVIQTSTGNRIEIEDQADSNRIKLETGDNKTYMHLGAPNHDGDGWVVITSGMERKEIKGGRQITVDTSPSASISTVAGENLDSGTLTAGNDISSSVLLAYPIAVIGIDNSKGTWKYKLKSVSTWQSILESVSTGTALLLDQTYEIKFSANSGTSGTTTLTYREWDGAVKDDADGNSQLAASVAHYVDLANTDLFESDSVSSSDSTEVLDLIDQIDEHDLFTFLKMSNDGVDTSSDSDRPQAGESLTRAEELTGEYIVQRWRGPEYNWDEGPDYEFQIGTEMEINYAENSTTTPGYPSNAGISYATLQTQLLDDLFGSSAGYAPTNAQAYGSANTKSWTNIINDAHIILGKHDTISGQKGNIYDFGGYWNYNLGNSYAENHSNQQAELNTQHSHDWPPAMSLGSKISAGLSALLGAIAGVSIARMATQRNPLKIAFVTSVFALMTLPSLFLSRKFFSPGTKDSGGGIDDLIAGADSFTEIKGRNITLPKDHAWVEKTFAKTGGDSDDIIGGSYSYTQANAIEINIGDTESHVRGNSHTYTYGGRHEEFTYSDEGVLVSWDSGSLWKDTAGFVNGCEVAFDRITGQPHKLEFSAMNINVELEVPTLPQLTLKYDGSCGNTLIHASLGGNIEIDLGEGDDLRYENDATGWRLETDSESAAFKARLEAVLGPLTELDLKGSPTGLEEMEIQLNELKCRLEDRLVDIENRFGGLEQKLNTKFATIENNNPPKISRQVGPLIKQRVLELQQAGLNISF